MIKTAKTPDAIKDLLWEDVPWATEYDDPVSLHNTLVLAAFVRGKEEGKTQRKTRWRKFVDWCWAEERLKEKRNEVPNM